MTEAEREREAIVAFLRAEEHMTSIRRPHLSQSEVAYANALSNAADAIERGDHLQGEGM